MGGCVTALVSALWAHAMELTAGEVAVASILAFIMGAVIMAQMTEVVESAVATLFVCYAEDPEAMQRSHPEEFQMLSAAFLARYGDLSGVPPQGAVYPAFSNV